jgi:hypothetical protein
MNAFSRFFVAVLCFVATFYFVFWAGGALIFSLLPPTAGQIVSLIIAIAAAVGVAVFIWKRSKAADDGLAASVLKGGFILGAIGFIAGFFGPIIFTPESNQGPLLGIFMTGPLGFVVGAIGGAVYWFARGRGDSRPE